jgi:hypothetical protein
VVVTAQFDSDIVKYLYTPALAFAGSLIVLLGGWLTAQYSMQAATKAWGRDRDRATEAWERARNDATEAWERAQGAAIQAWSRARSDAAASLAVQAMKELATVLAQRAHNVCWIAWRAKFDPETLTKDEIRPMTKACTRFCHVSSARRRRSPPSTADRSMCWMLR